MTPDAREQIPEVAAFDVWHASWWRNLPNPIMHANAFDAFLAGWDAALSRPERNPDE